MLRHVLCFLHFLIKLFHSVALSFIVCLHSYILILLLSALVTVVDILPIFLLQMKTFMTVLLE